MRQLVLRALDKVNVLEGRDGRSCLQKHLSSGTGVWAERIHSPEKMALDSWRQLGRVKREGDLSQVCKDSYQLHQACLSCRKPSLKSRSLEVISVS